MGVQGCSPTLAISLWPLTCPGIALPMHGTNGFKWLPNHWALHVYFSLTRSEGGMGARNAEKAPYLWINWSTNTDIYHAFCWKNKIKLHENLTPMQTRTHMCTWVWNYLRLRLDLQRLRPLGHLAMKFVPEILFLSSLNYFTGNRSI